MQVADEVRHRGWFKGFVLRVEGGGFRVEGPTKLYREQASCQNDPPIDSDALHNTYNPNSPYRPITP